ncbi:MAG TPA: hypothetical protein VGE31_02075 [Candidatus Paceibacterota bacterium]
MQTNKIIDRDEDICSVHFPADQLNMQGLSPRHELCGGFDINVYFKDGGNPVSIDFILAKDEDDITGPEFSEQFQPKEKQLIIYILDLATRYPEAANFKYSLCGVALADSDEARREEIEGLTGRWLADFISEHFTVFSNIRADRTNKDRLIARLSVIFRPSEDSRDFEFQFLLSEAEDMGISPEDISDYFGLVPA